MSTKWDPWIFTDDCSFSTLRKENKEKLKKKEEDKEKAIVRSV